MKRVSNYDNFVLNELNRETYLSAADRIKDKSPFAANQLREHALKKALKDIRKEKESRTFATVGLLRLEEAIGNNIAKRERPAFIRKCIRYLRKNVSKHNKWLHFFLLPEVKQRAKMRSSWLFFFLTPPLSYELDKETKEIIINGENVFVQYNDTCCYEMEEQRLHSVLTELLPRNAAMHLFKHTNGNADSWRDLWNGK